GGDAGRARQRARAVLAVHVLRHPAVDLVLVVAARIVERAHRRRQSHSQGAVSRRGATDRDGARGPRPLPVRPADTGRVLPVLRGTAGDGGSALAARGGGDSVDPHAGTGAHGVGADRALPRSARSACEPDDAVVLRDADRVSVVPGTRAGASTPQPESVHAPRHCLSAGTVRARSLRAMATPARHRRGICHGAGAWLCRVRSAARYVGGGSVNAIEVRDVHKVYRRYGRRKHFGTLKSALLSGGVLRQMRPDEVLEALNGVSFDVANGRTFGIIGRNGSGKSTMLKLIAGIGKPTSGIVRVNGRVSALIELGAGFHPEISGR